MVLEAFRIRDIWEWRKSERWFNKYLIVFFFFLFSDSSDWFWSNWNTVWKNVGSFSPTHSVDLQICHYLGFLLEFSDFFLLRFALFGVMEWSHAGERDGHWRVTLALKSEKVLVIFFNTSERYTKFQNRNHKITKLGRDNTFKPGIIIS